MTSMAMSWQIIPNTIKPLVGKNYFKSSGIITANYLNELREIKEARNAENAEPNNHNLE